MSILTGIGGETLTGNWPGYVLTFHRVLPGGKLDETASLVLHSDEYEAEIELSLSGGLERLGATIVLAGLTDVHHQMLTARTGSGTLALAAMKVHLFWRDANSTVGGYLTSLVGGGGLDAILSAGGAGMSSADRLKPFRIADLTVTGVSRRRGTRRYETVLTGLERVRARTAVPLPEPVSLTGLASAARKLAKLAGIDVKVEPIVPADPAKEPDDLPFTASAGQPVRTGFARLGERIELVTGRYGRGMLLIRDGVLHVGPRAIPLDHDPWPLDWPAGLLSVEALPHLAADGAADPEADGLPSAAPHAAGARRAQWKIMLRGRPEIKPGHVVTFAPPPGEGTVERGLAKALLGSFAALGSDDGTPRVSGYVNAVRHTMNRSTGFLTELTVVVLKAGEDGWDQRATPTTSAEAKGSGGKKPDRPDAAGALGDELDRRIAEPGRHGRDSRGRRGAGGARRGSGAASGCAAADSVAGHQARGGRRHRGRGAAASRTHDAAGKVRRSLRDALRLGQVRAGPAPVSRHAGALPLPARAAGGSGRGGRAVAGPRGTRRAAR